MVTNRTDDILRLIDEEKREQYQRGWNDAVAHIASIASKPVFAQQHVLPLNTIEGGEAIERRIPMIEAVYDAIAAKPGMRGSEIVSAIHNILPDRDRKALDRTVRTALARLKERDQKIISIEGKWYPNPMEGA